jgi:opine dehydrogenase
MRVAILGAGSIGFATAAFLCAHGHAPVLWSPSGRRTRALAGGAKLIASGLLDGAFQPGVAASCAEAVQGADCVLIAVPGYGHRAVIEAAAPHLRDDQIVVFSSHMSFSALLLRRLCPAPTIVAWGSTVITARQTSEADITVTNIRSRLDAAVLPQGDSSRGLDLCQALFGDRFTLRDGLLAIALSNLNPQNHLPIALCNLTRMERGEVWRQYANITPAVARLIEALDTERLALAAACGVQVRSVQEHFRLSFGVQGATLADMVGELAMRDTDPVAPATLETRYVIEDVPFGLWPTICLASVRGVAMPLHEAGVRTLSALYGRDLAADNDILPVLGDLSDVVPIL